MSLALVGRRYLAASQAAIEHHDLEWPIFGNVLRTLRRLRGDTGIHGATAELEELIASLWGWTGQLTGSPVAPASVGTSEFATRLRAHVESGRDSGYAALLIELASLLERLVGQSHPAAPVLEDVISRYGSEPGDPPAVYIAARHDGLELLERWLGVEELDAEVRDVAELKRADIRQALVLLGSPSGFYVSAWCPLPTASRIGGWLLAAPPASAVHVLTWPGHPPFDIDGVPLLPTTPKPQIDVAVRHHAGAAVPMAAEPAWLPPLPVEAEIKVGSWAMDKEPVAATGFRLAGGTVAFFHADLGPGPQLVTWDVGAIVVTDINVRKIKEGQALLFRPDRSATDDELCRRAGAFLNSKYGDGALENALAAKQELKEALGRSNKTHERLVYELTLRLNDDQYARHIINRLADDDYIAPEKPGAYPALRQVLGLSPNDEQYRWVRALRVALRRAGHEITDELINVLTTTTAWQASLEAGGVATIAASDELGCLELRVVTAVDPTLRKVGRSRLGRLLPDSQAPSARVA